MSLFLACQFSFEPCWDICSRYKVHIGLLVLLHFNVQPNSVLKEQPEITISILLLFGISVSKAILILGFLVVDFFPFSDSEREVVLDDFGLTHSSLADAGLVNSNDTVI